MCSKNIRKAIIGELVRQKNIPEDLITRIQEYTDHSFLKMHKKMISSLEQEYYTYNYYLYHHALAPWIFGDEDNYWSSVKNEYSTYDEFCDDIKTLFENHHNDLLEELEEANDKDSLLVKNNSYYKVLFERRYTSESEYLQKWLINLTWHDIYTTLSVGY